jgi:hypothetical protein
VIAWRCGDYPTAQIVAELASNTASEAGSAATLSLRLNRRPTAPVRVRVLSSDVTEILPNLTELLFEPNNWNQPQEVRINGVNDDVADGDQNTELNISVTKTTDVRFTKAPTVQLPITNLDDDEIGWNTLPPQQPLREGGPALRYQIALASRPTAPVYVRIRNQTPEAIRVTPAELTFYPDTWQETQPVQVTSLDDNFDNPDRNAEVLLSVRNTEDDAYAQLAPLRLQLVSQDNEETGIAYTPETATVAEFGTAATFSIRLKSQPRSPVLLELSSSDASEGQLDLFQMRFTSEDWDQVVPVALQGLNDLQQDGDQAFQVRLRAISTDPTYSTLGTIEIPVINQDDDNAGLDLDVSAEQTSEDGNSSEITVRLSSEPKGTVLVSLSSTAPGEGVVFPEMLTFDQTNWNLKQRVLVVGKDDSRADGDQTYQIILQILGDSPEYLALPSRRVALTNLDNDIASIQIRAPEQLNTSEAGTTDQFEVLLQSQPKAPVRIQLRPSLPAEVSVSPTELELTPENWNQPQRIVVTGLDDRQLDGPQSFLVQVLPAQSADQLYDGLDAADLVGTNEDNDQAGIVTSTRNVRVAENYGESRFDVSLASQPNQEVRLRLVSSNPDEFMVLPEQLVFSPQNWEQQQSVLVRGLPDEVAEANATYRLRILTEAGEDAYQNIEPLEIFVAVEDKTPELPPTMIRAMRGLQQGTAFFSPQRALYEEDEQDFRMDGQAQGFRYSYHWPSLWTAGAAFQMSNLTGDDRLAGNRLQMEVTEQSLLASAGRAFYLTPSWRLHPQLSVGYSQLSAERIAEQNGQRTTETLDGSVATFHLRAAIHYLANETLFVGAGLNWSPNQTTFSFADDTDGTLTTSWSGEVQIGLQF